MSSVVADGPTANPPVTRASGEDGPSALAFDATSVYWANISTTVGRDGSVVRVAKWLSNGRRLCRLPYTKPGAKDDSCRHNHRRPL
jgi:hypothetical protein